MTIPQNVADALSRVHMMVDSASEWADIDLADWQTIRAHLLSQDAEIERLQSGLAAANALLRFMHTRFDACMDDSDRASIEAHLSENADVQP